MISLINMHKRTLLVTSLIILLPMLMGLLLWPQLPDTMATHFDANNEPNGFSSKAFAVFVPPLFVLACEWFCVFATASDPKRANISPKVLRLMLWVCPLVSLLSGAAIYGYALSWFNSVNMSRIALIMLGMLFVFIGNYLPKCRQSYTFGLRLPWTLDDPENWNRTHRFAGRLWMAAGLLIAVSAFLPWGFSVLLGATLVMVLAPVVYSYWNAKQKTDRRSL